MECGHAFCDDCWRQHLTIQITDGNAKRLPCMGVKCGVICDETKVTGSLLANWSATCFTFLTSTHVVKIHLAILTIPFLAESAPPQPKPTQHAPVAAS